MISCFLFIKQYKSVYEHERIAQRIKLDWRSTHYIYQCFQENYDIFNISFYYYKDVDVYSLFISHNLVLNIAPLVLLYSGAAIINSVTEALQHAQKTATYASRGI